MLRKKIQEEVEIFFNALVFYTRIPCPTWVTYDAEKLNSATRYFPMIGWIIGAICATTFCLFFQFYTAWTALILALVASIWTTGAFHEDGLADSCDAFGGGWQKNQILKIMKDSRIGTYGTVGLLLIFLLKISILHEIFEKLNYEFISIFLVFISAHSLSRLMPTILMLFHDYTGSPDASKSKPIAKKLTAKTFIIACVLGLFPLIILSWMTQNPYFLTLVAPLYVVQFQLGKFFEKWIEGYTGDALGATQQICEVVFYLGLGLISN